MAADAQKGKRYAFVDHYRGWAVVVMIETHSVNAWLSDSLRQTEWFGLLNHINGMVAPSFLFISGVSFAIIASKKFELISRWTPEFRRLFWRYAWIWALGYLLHLPRIRWSGSLPSVVTEDLASFFQPDVLQVIALSLIVLLLLCILLRDKRSFLAATFLLAAGSVLATPFLWRVDFSQSLHPFLANYMNGLHNPLFPMFPWAVFCWVGALVGTWFLDAAEAGRDANVMIGVLGIGIVLFAGGSFLSRLSWVSYTNFWLDSPEWAAMRLGIVCGLFVLFWRMEAREMKPMPPVLLVGRESLTAYVFHLLAMYSITGPKAGFPLLLYRGYAIGTTAALYAALLSVTTGAAWLRARLRRAKRAA